MGAFKLVKAILFLAIVVQLTSSQEGDSREKVETLPDETLIPELTTRYRIEDEQIADQKYGSGSGNRINEDNSAETTKTAIIEDLENADGAQYTDSSERQRVSASDSVDDTEIEHDELGEEDEIGPMEDDYELVNFKADLYEILEDVKEVGCNGCKPGSIILFGLNAFPILSGTKCEDKDAGQPTTVAAALNYGSGRMVFFADPLFLQSITAPGQKDLSKLLVNSFKWATRARNQSQANTNSKLQARILSMSEGGVDIKDFLSENGYDAEVIDYNKLENKIDLISQMDLIILQDMSGISESVFNKLAQFTFKGGAIVATYQESQNHFKANELLAELGIVCEQQCSLPKRPKPFPVTWERLKGQHGGQVAMYINAFLTKSVVPDKAIWLKAKDRFNYTLQHVNKSLIPWVGQLQETLQKSYIALDQSKIIAFTRKKRFQINMESFIKKQILDSEKPTTTTYSVDTDQNLAEILNNVNLVGCDHCRPGILVLYGPNAFPILAGVKCRGEEQSVVASAANYGKGRIVALADANFLDFAADRTDLPTFILNCINWATKSKIEPTTFKLRAAVVKETSFIPSIINLLTSNGFECEVIEYSTLSNEAVLAESYDILIIPDATYLKIDVTNILKNYVKKGGAILAAIRPHNYNFNDTFTANEFLRESGMVWGIRCVRVYTPVHFNASVELLTNLHSGKVAFEMVKRFHTDEVINEDRQAFEIGVLKLAILNANTSDLLWLSTLKEEFLEGVVLLNASKEYPIESTPTAKCRLSVEEGMYTYILTPEEMPAHPSSIGFPGTVDPSAKELQKKTYQIFVPLSLNGSESHEYAFSTGYYAPPGMRISIEIQGAEQFKFKVQIGCHVEKLKDKSQWVRFPAITTSQTFLGQSAVLAWPFGGLVYLKNIERQNGSNSTTNMTVLLSGVVPAPTFIKDKTTLSDWKTIRKFKAPSAEFVNDRISFCIAGVTAAEVDDPEEVMLYFTEAAEHMSDLLGETLGYTRFVFDRDIRLGYMHSGNPIMGFVENAYLSMDIRTLRRGSTDCNVLYHEIGHNIQKREWTVSFGREITNNIFALYVANVGSGVLLEDVYSYLQPEYVRSKLKILLDTKEDLYEKLRGDWAWHLTFYYHLQKLFGWGAFRRVFQAYQKLDEKPQEDNEKIDMWMIQFSIVVERNLVVLFKSWGLPISDHAAESVAHLPSSGFLITDLFGEFNNTDN